MFYRYLIRPLLYRLSAETAHNLTLGCLSLLSGWPPMARLLRRLTPRHPAALRVRAMGLDFPSPVGLAAGLDKGAQAYLALGATGFGFVEVGTLTGVGQPGNPKPRLFRLPQDRALINRMGFNNDGAPAAAARIRATGRAAVPLGINIGKTKAVPAESAADDYAASTRALAPLADYLVVNVSSPNTPGLRDLQAVSTLRPLLARVRAEAEAACPDRHVPLLVKIAPDLADEDVDAVAELALALQLDGIIAVNTTVARAPLTTPTAEVAAYGAGGLSGPPLKARALEVLRRLRRRAGDRLTLISVGGIDSTDDVWERLSAGANLVQLYTALIYEGPGLPTRLARGLSARLHEEGVDSVAALTRRACEAEGPSAT